MTALATAAPARKVSAAHSWLFAIAVFTSASLVFTVEPLIGKLFLPSLGGTPATWNTTLAFFQGALLVGYGYAHLLQKAGAVRRQVVIHLAALALAALALPLRPSLLLGEPWEAAPAPWLTLNLALTVGAPFAVLSATAPLLQAWYARLCADDANAPDAYALYAASNLGSLIALAAYPIVIEPLMGLRNQALSWSIAYGGFVLLLGVLAGRIWPLAEKPKAEVEAAPPVTWRDRLAWIALAAGPSSLLVGVTAHISADVASAPFLWVIPLELYLVTFVIAFRSKAKPVSDILRIGQIVAVGSALVLISQPNSTWLTQLGVHLLAFFTTSLVCHKTLVERRPAHGRLTEFYLMMSLGGVVGGSFNAFLAPLLFNLVWEYPVVLALTCLAGPWSVAKAWRRREFLVFAVGLLCLATVFFNHPAIPSQVRWAAPIVAVGSAVLLRRRGLLAAVLLVTLAISAELQAHGRFLAHFRSFFGVTHIMEQKARDLGPLKVMIHGTTLHGVQPLDPARRCTPTTYYAQAGPIGTTFRTEQQRKQSMHIGAVGLGVGTVAAYVRPSDRIRFYEIDPQVIAISTDPAWFSYLSACAKGPVDIVSGDGRLSLRKEADGAFDLLLVDAFSSDSIPTHMLTAEAVRGYLRVVKPDGVVVLHLSNRNLALAGPAAAAARQAGGSALLRRYKQESTASLWASSPAEVLVIAHNPEQLARYRAQPGWREPDQSSRAWTDDYTTIWRAMMDAL